MSGRRRAHRSITSTIVCLVLLVTLFRPAAANSRSVRVIVQGTTLEAAAGAVRDTSGVVEAHLPVIDAVIARVAIERIAVLASSQGVVRVTGNREVTVGGKDFAGNGNAVDVEFAKTVGLGEVWDAGLLGQNTTVAILDTGVDPHFAELRRTPSVAHERYLAYYDALEDKLYEGNAALKSAGDPNGHGTHVAGIIGNAHHEQQDGEYRGVAPATNLVAVRVLDELGRGTYADVLKGINWVVQHKDDYNIRVLNISMYAAPIAPYWADPYNLAVMAAWHAGIVVVASVGNTGPQPMSVGVPGNTPYIITVGTFTDHRTPDDLGDDYIPEFSAAGPTLDAFVKPDVVAPGAHIVSFMRPHSYLRDAYPDRRIDGRYFEMSGTSMSTAIVSGLAALMLSDNPELTPDQVKYRLTQSARPQLSESTGAAAYSIWQQGAGRVWAPDAILSDMDGVANQGMDLAADLAGVQHYQGWTTFDPSTGTFGIIGGGLDGWVDDYTVWDGSFDSWADGYEPWAGGSTNWSGSFDSWADSFDSWADSFDSWADSFDSWADSFDSWADSFDSWADTCVPSVPGAEDVESWGTSFDSWADGFDSWADSFDSWADFTAWTDSFDSWADSFDSWADSFDSWADGAEGCGEWVDSFDSWADGFLGWRSGISDIAAGFTFWADAYSMWTGGYLTWSTSFDNWADSFDSWADGYAPWAEACGVDAESFDSWADGFGGWAGSFDTWAGSFDSWADSFDSWADYVLWVDSFDSWADSFDSWADSFDSWADGYVGGSRPLLCGGWADSFDSWADSFDSWADSFDSWADANPNLAGAFSTWDGGYTSWAGGPEAWTGSFDSWADSVGDPDWANGYSRLANVPSAESGVSNNIWVTTDD